MNGNATGSPRKDITARASSMPRDSAILYPNPRPRGEDPPAYIGIMRSALGELFWLAAWGRTVAGRAVIEIRMQPKK